MNRSQKRQFHQLRSQSSKSGRSSIMASSRRSQTNELCVNCINRILSDQQSNKRKHQRYRQQEEEQRLIQELNRQVDGNKIRRQQMKNQALLSNKLMIEENRETEEKQKQQDKAFCKAAEIKEKVIKEQIDRHRELEQKKLRIYRQQIQEQYKSAIHQKEESKRNKVYSQPENQVLPLSNRNMHREKLYYNMQLKQQIEQKKQRLKNDKVRQEERERKLLAIYSQQVNKYHADNYHLRDTRNPQIFKEMKELQNKKISQSIKIRNQNQKLRSQMLRKQNQQRSQQIQFKMKEMQDYVETLRTQMMAKKQHQHQMKLKQQAFIEKIPKSTEQLNKEYQVQKCCHSCHHSYKQQYISQVPK